jgi:GGDEF domain-containing protein
MVYCEAVGDVFRELERGGTLQAALQLAVSTARTATGSAAAGIVVGGQVMSDRAYCFQDDPEKLLGNEARRLPDRASERGDEVLLPLKIADMNVGLLALVRTKPSPAERLAAGVPGLTAALATLLAVAERSVSDPQTPLRNREGFRNALLYELARAQRYGDRFSVIHVCVAEPDRAECVDRCNPWSHAAELGAMLADRLRTADVVGLLGPDRLAVLLPRTGPVGARVAARRIEQCLNTGDSYAGAPVRVRSSLVRSCPEDGADVETYLDAAEAGEDLAKSPAGGSLA